MGHLKVNTYWPRSAAGGKKYLLASLNFWRKIAKPIPTQDWAPAIRVKSNLSLFKEYDGGEYSVHSGAELISLLEYSDRECGATPSLLREEKS
jgi:hypothetical protein